MVWQPYPDREKLDGNKEVVVVLVILGCDRTEVLGLVEVPLDEER